MLGSTRLNVGWESLDSTTGGSFKRSAWGGSLLQKVGDSIEARVQVFSAGDYDGTTDSGALAYAVGGNYKLGKSTGLYLVYAAVQNDANAQFNIAGSGHGDSLKTTAVDIDPYAISFGMIHKF